LDDDLTLPPSRMNVDEQIEWASGLSTSVHTPISANILDLPMFFESASHQTVARTPEGPVHSIEEEEPHYSDEADPEMIVPESTAVIPQSVVQFAQ